MHESNREPKHGWTSENEKVWFALAKAAVYLLGNIAVSGADSHAQLSRILGIKEEMIEYKHWEGKGHKKPRFPSFLRFRHIDTRGV
jgi:hypothetical protein